jgi:hypothetical protein
VHRHLHQRANSVYARKLELDEWWNHEPHSRKIEPPQIFSEGSRRHVTVIHSEEERPESNPSPSGRLAECVGSSPSGWAIHRENLSRNCRRRAGNLALLALG